MSKDLDTIKTLLAVADGVLVSIYLAIILK